MVWTDVRGPNYLRREKLSREITKQGVKNDAALTSAGIRIRMLADWAMGSWERILLLWQGTRNQFSLTLTLR